MTSFDQWTLSMGTVTWTVVVLSVLTRSVLDMLFIWAVCVALNHLRLKAKGIG